MDLLRQYGWEVDERYLGKASSHHQRYHVWEKLLSEDDPRYPVVRYNLHNANDLWFATRRTKIKMRDNKTIFKDKSDERNPSFPQEHATHLTEGADVVMMENVVHRKLGEGSSVW